MRLKRDGDYLDFNEDVPLTYKSTWVGSISSSRIISAQFDIAATAENLKLLGINSINEQNKIIYHQNIWTLETDLKDITGYLRVESKNDSTVQCSFLSNGFDFLTLITGSLSDINFRNYIFTGYDNNSEGWVTPPVNNGNNTRMISGDFSNYEEQNNLPSFYVKSIIHDMLMGFGIKLTGDILNDWLYNHLIITNDSMRVEYNDAYINSKTLFVGKIASQAVAAPNTTVTFIEGGIYFDNPDLWNGVDTYTAEFNQDLIAEINIVTDTAGAYGVAIFDQTLVANVAVFSINGQTSGYKKLAFPVGAGSDYQVIISGIGAYNVLAGSSLRIYPFNKFNNNGVDLVSDPLQEYFPQFILPDMTNKEFITTILSLFNPVIDFNPTSKTLEVNFFKNLKNQEAVDWSDKVNSISFDFIETVSDYGKRSTVIWEDPDDEFIESYNERNINPFAGGSINIDNDFIEEEKELINVPFAPSLQELNDVVNAYLPTFNFFQRNYGKSVLVTSVSNSAGNAQFNTAFTFEDGDYVELSGFTEPSYNGVGLITAVASGSNITVNGVAFVSNDTGTAVPIRISEQKQSRRLMIALPSPVINFSNFSVIDYGSTTKSSMPYAWTSKPTVGKPIDIVKTSVAFEDVNISGYNELTIKESYFNEFERVLNDPVKGVGSFYLSGQDILAINSNTPVRIKTEKFNALFLVNIVDNYLVQSCEVELIKL